MNRNESIFESFGTTQALLIFLVLVTSSHPGKFLIVINHELLVVIVRKPPYPKFSQVIFIVSRSISTYILCQTI